MKQSLYFLIILFLICSQANEGYAQCLPDRHNTSLNTQWLSCSASQNPNSSRGMSHWAMLALNEDKGLGEVTLWNLNHPYHLDNGMNQIAIDVSLDGNNWTEVYTGNLPQAQADSEYEGTMLIDLGWVGARFIVITSLSNYGGSCHGLAELRIETGEFDCGSEFLTVNANPVSAGLYSADQVLTSEGVVANNDVWLQGGNQVCLDPGFEVQVGATFTASNDPCQ